MLWYIFPLSCHTDGMDKFVDNKLAEEMDLIVLTTNALRPCGLPCGSVGTLVYGYTRRDKPLYGAFLRGKRRLEAALGLKDFRVLNPDNALDLPIIAAYLKTRRAV